SPSPSGAIPYKLYNIGNSSPVPLLDFIKTIEEVTGKKAIIQMEEMQPGDVTITYADTTKLQNEFGYKPQTSVRKGIEALYKSILNL
ncbi:MAG TPA: NAD-dependent epimerase, partial [Bacteroidales bacterium]|nr:NAD-dependent epimerase [Bacteroidales bacterium]